MGSGSSSSSGSGSSVTNTPVTLARNQWVLCPSYSVSWNTNSANNVQQLCSFSLCPNDRLTVSLCGSGGASTCSGNTYVRIVDSASNTLMTADDGCGQCSYGLFEASPSVISSCGTYYLAQGCSGSATSCGGQAGLFLDYVPTAQPTVYPSYSPTQSPTPSPTVSPTQSPTQIPTLSPTSFVANYSKALESLTGGKDVSIITDSVRVVSERVNMTSNTPVQVQIPLTDTEKGLVASGQLVVPSVSLLPNANGTGNASVQVAVALVNKSAWNTSSNSSSGGNKAGSLQSDIVIVQVGGGVNYVDITFPAGSSTSTPINFTIACRSGEFVLKNYTCTDSGYVENYKCVGIAGTYKGECPVLKATCAALDLSAQSVANAATGQTCTELNSTSGTIICRCSLGKNPLQPGTGTVAAGLMFQFVGSDFSNTFKAAAALNNAGAASKAATIIVLFATLWGTTLISMFYQGWRQNKKEAHAMTKKQKKKALQIAPDPGASQEGGSRVNPWNKAKSVLQSKYYLGMVAAPTLKASSDNAVLLGSFMTATTTATSPTSHSRQPLSVQNSISDLSIVPVGSTSISPPYSLSKSGFSSPRLLSMLKSSRSLTSEDRKRKQVGTSRLLKHRQAIFDGGHHERINTMLMRRERRRTVMINASITHGSPTSEVEDKDSFSHLMNELMAQSLLLEDDSETQSKFHQLWGLDTRSHTFLEPKTIWKTRSFLFLCRKQQKEVIDISRLVKEEVEGVAKSAEEMKEELERLSSEAERGFDILQMLVMDLLGRDSAAARIFAIKSELEHERVNATSWWTKMNVVVALLCIDGFLMYYAILKGFSKGLQWQSKYVLAWALQVVLDVFLFGTIHCLWFHFIMPRMVAKEVHSAEKLLRRTIRSIYEREKDDDASDGILRKSADDELDASIREESSRFFYFNGAHFLHVSYRLAEQFPTLLESAIARAYTSPFPGAAGIKWANAVRLWQGEQELSSEQNETGRKEKTVARFAMIPLRCLTSLLLVVAVNIPVEVQSIIIRMMEPLFLYLFTTFYMVLQDHPIIFGVTVGVSVLVLGVLIWDSYRNRRKASRKVTEEHEQQDDVQSGGKAKKQAKAMMDPISEEKNDDGNEVSSLDHSISMSSSSSSSLFSLSSAGISSLVFSSQGSRDGKPPFHSRKLSDASNNSSVASSFIRSMFSSSRKREERRNDVVTLGKIFPGDSGVSGVDMNVNSILGSVESSGNESEYDSDSCEVGVNQPRSPKPKLRPHPAVGHEELPLPSDKLSNSTHSSSMSDSLPSIFTDNISSVHANEDSRSFNPVNIKYAGKSTIDTSSSNKSSSFPHIDIGCHGAAGQANGIIDTAVAERTFSSDDASSSLSESLHLVARGQYDGESSESNRSLSIENSFSELTSIDMTTSIRPYWKERPVT
eukprot:gene3684-4031_t